MDIRTLKREYDALWGIPPRKPFGEARFTLNGRDYVAPIFWARPTFADVVEPFQDAAIAAGLSVAGEGFYEINGIIVGLASKDELRGKK